MCFYNCFEFIIAQSWSTMINGLSFLQCAACKLTETWFAGLPPWLQLEQILTIMSCFWALCPSCIVIQPPWTSIHFSCADHLCTSSIHKEGLKVHSHPSLIWMLFNLDCTLPWWLKLCDILASWASLNFLFGVVLAIVKEKDIFRNQEGCWILRQSSTASSNQILPHDWSCSHHVCPLLH